MDDQEQFLIEMENDEECRKRTEEALRNMEAEFQERKDRVAKLRLIHEDVVYVDKIDARSMQTFLITAPGSKEERIRQSYYGMILKVSENSSGDEVRDFKKGLLKVGDIVAFNPDTGYSRNIITPKDMPTIWVVHIDNILDVDEGFDLVACRKKTIIADLTIERIKAHNLEKAHRAAEAKKKKEDAERQIIQGR